MNHSQNSTQALTTFEDLQQHMDSFDVDSLGELETLLPSRLGENIEHLASVYQMVEPVLTVVGALPIVPSSWRRALALLMSAIDTIVMLASDASFRPEDDFGDDEAEDQLEDFKAGRDLEEFGNFEEFKAGRDLEE